ncbi:hypothetical protein RchiOBHm_Chr5g0034511 [Rosa chinensis]|uniref:Uncharacterized protein n=1 Tax=Rosa chinensis TaxID=74649 RepID=A0A2P6QAZ7_ROSCH|nr:hypothetical protein RchiOBHm_Chr5g0034511 [Rosa chinensis]
MTSITPLNLCNYSIFKGWTPSSGCPSPSFFFFFLFLIFLPPSSSAFFFSSSLPPRFDLETQIIKFFPPPYSSSLFFFSPSPI